MQTSNNKGILVIFHGSKDKEWVATAHDIVKKAAFPVPALTSFLETYPGVSMPSIQDSVSQFIKKGIHDILVIPLFLSSYTTHLEDIRTILGIRTKLPYERMTCTIEPACTVQLCDPLNSHPIVSKILTQRIHELLIADKMEPIVLIAHGVNDSRLYDSYEQMVVQIIQQIEQQLALLSSSLATGVERTVPIIKYATFYPDTIRTVVESVVHDGTGTPLIVPLFLSEGFFTKHKIPQKLVGIPYGYTGKALLPSPEIAYWLREQAKPFIESTMIPFNSPS